MQDGTHEFPDARIEIAVVCENHELKSGYDQLNPLLQQIVAARAAAAKLTKTKLTKARPKNPHFGRLTFSQRG